MLEVRCPNCDAPIATHADARGMAECARCGRIFDADVRSKPMAEHEGFDKTPALTVPTPAFPGNQLFRAVQRLARRSSFILRTKSVLNAGGPAAIRGANQSQPRRRFGRLRPELRRIFFAALVFLGVPGALIFFVIVVCAPKEDAVLRHPVRAERPQPAKTVRNSWLQKLRP